MKKITLKRPLETFNKKRSYEIFIEKRKLAELGNGEQKTIDVPADLENGKIMAKVGWCGSKRTNLGDWGRKPIFTIKGNQFLHKKMPLYGALFPVVAFVILSNVDSNVKNVGIGLLVVVLLGLVGTLTIWRNRWLTIEKTK